MDNAKEDQKKNFVSCSNFTSRFVLTQGSHVFDAKLTFHNVTFHAFSRLDKICNVTATAVNNNTVISEAVIACRDMFVRVCHVRHFVYFNSDIAVHNIRSPYVRLTIKYTFAPVYNVALITAAFEQMNSVEHFMPIRTEYLHFKNQLGYMMYDHFLISEKNKVDAALFDRFQCAIQLSGIIRVLNLTVML